MANDFLVSKWKLLFSWFDNNKDLKVCAEDLETAKSRFANLHHYDAERRKAVMDAYSAWWRDYIMWGKPEITEAEFIECQKKAYEDDREEFVRRNKKNQSFICNLMDADGDGMLTEEDTVIMMKSTEHNDETVDHRWFEGHNPVDGKLPVQTMADMWANFLTCEDSSKPDAVLELFKSVLKS